MSSAILARIVKLEERRRPAPYIESKSARDGRVAAWGTVLPDVLPADPQKRAAIMAATRADT